MPSPNTWYYAIHNAHEYEDVFVSAKYTGTPQDQRVWSAVTVETDGSNFNVASDGTYSVLLGQWLADGIAGPYTLIVNTTVEYITPAWITESA